MSEELDDCWKIMQCGRETGGSNVSQDGECVAARKGFGHSCWAIAGTLCGGEVQGTEAQKKKNCMVCRVYRLYHRITGEHGREIKKKYPDEERRYLSILMDRLKK